MRIQVTLHVKYKGDNPSVTEMAGLYRTVEEWANRLARTNTLPRYFTVEVIDVFNVNRVRDYIDNPSTEGPF